MHLILLLVFSALAQAATAAPYTTSSGCVAAAHVPSADVAAEAGTGAGTRVTPADVNGRALSAPDFERNQMYAAVPLADYATREQPSKAVAGLLGGSDIFIGDIRVAGDSVTLDGRELNPPAGIGGTGCP